MPDTKNAHAVTVYVNKDLLESGRRWTHNIKTEDIKAQRDGASGTQQSQVRDQRRGLVNKAVSLRVP
jgi:hypothetical protein